MMMICHHYRVDQQYSNSFEKWKAMGRPQQVSDEQYRELASAGQLQLITSPGWEKIHDGEIVLKFYLPKQGVSLIQLTW